MQFRITWQPWVAAILMTSFSGIARSADALLFVSSFAAGDTGCISTFHLDSEQGKLTRKQVMRDVEHPFFMALSPAGQYLYSNHSPEFGGRTDEQVAAFRVERKTGQLTLLNRQSTRGTGSCYLDVDRTGKTVVVANYSSGSVAALPIQADGSLAPSSSFVQHRGSSVRSTRQSEPHAHCLVISPDNRFAYAADLGTDQVFTYALNPLQAQLTPHQQRFVRTLPGAGPRHLTFHPDGNQLYAINELANSITLFHLQPSSGFLLEQTTISTLPPGFDGTSHTADLKVTPDGRFLYGTNRGHDSIAAYRILSDGQLKLLAIEPSLGKGPQNLLITPDGRFLLCANMPGDNIAVFQISADGKLAPIGEPMAVKSPSCILLLP